MVERERYKRGKDKKVKRDYIEERILRRKRYKKQKVVKREKE